MVFSFMEGDGESRLVLRVGRGFYLLEYIRRELYGLVVLFF